MSATDPRRVARIYQDTRERITSLLRDLDDAALNTAVTACPGWSVRDVVAHLAAVADDFGQGRLTGPPTDEETAAQIARFDGQGMPDIVAAWTDAAAHLNHLAESAGVELPVGDIASHEHDVRAAMGRPGARDSDAVVYSSDRLLTNLRPPMPLKVSMDLTVYGRQEPWEDSPTGWPQEWIVDGSNTRTDGRPIPQWSRLEAPKHR